MTNLVGIIGSSSQTLGSEQEYQFAYDLGAALVKAGYKIVNGGADGVMEASAKGAKSVSTPEQFDVLCIIKQEDKTLANPFCDVVIPSGMGIMRNTLIVRTADVLVAIGGGAGTLSEIAMAWQYGKKVLCVTQFGGWAARLAGKDLDQRYSDLLIPVTSVEQIVQKLKEIL